MVVNDHHSKLVNCLHTLAFGFEHTHQATGYVILILFSHHKIDIITLCIEIYCRCNIGHLYFINL